MIKITVTVEKDYTKDDIISAVSRSFPLEAGEISNLQILKKKLEA